MIQMPSKIQGQISAESTAQTWNLNLGLNSGRNFLKCTFSQDCCQDKREGSHQGALQQQSGDGAVCKRQQNRTELLSKKCGKRLAMRLLNLGFWRTSRIASSDQRCGDDAWARLFVHGRIAV